MIYQPPPGPIDLVIPKITDEQFNAMTPKEQATYLTLFVEQVPAPFEEWRNPHRVKLAYGGRGAGAKSRSSASLLIQFAENPSYFGDRIRVLCVRQVQKSIAESSWRTLKDELDRLGYRGWKVTDDYLRNEKNGSYFTFAGLNNLTKDNLKSLSDYDILYAEEAAPIEREAWTTIDATFRKPMSELWIVYNRTNNADPCHELYAQNPDHSWSIIPCRPGRLDNPWFPEILQKQWDRLKETDPDEALHVYEGFPRAIGDRAVFRLRDVIEMKDRLVSDDGGIAIGCDVARFGRDSTIAWKRKGMRILERRSVNGFATGEVVGMLMDMANRDPSIPIKVDVGYNPGVVDGLSAHGMNVVPVGFGDAAKDSDAYVNAAAEMMFTLPVHEIGIPAEYFTNELVEDLTERFYGYDAKDRKKLEPKDGTQTNEDGSSKKNFKGRHGGRSPDDGDALCLCFYDRSNNWALL